MFLKKIQVEKEYREFILEILNQYSLSIKLEFVPDVIEWQKKHNCLLRKNQSCFTLAATVRDSEGDYIILMNKEMSEQDIKNVKDRIIDGDLLKETKDFIKHLILHEICHVLISLNKKDGIIDDLCDTWAFNEMCLLKRTTV